MSAATRAQFHDEKRQIAYQQLLDRMRVNDKIGYRMTHPSYRGLPDNSTGSKMRPFFINKDESHIPLEEKIKGGSLSSTPEGRAYIQRILSQRARDVEAIERAETRPFDTTPIETDRVVQQFGLQQYLTQIGDSLEVGKYDVETVDAFRQALSSLLS
jgi:hypothetical protein